MHRVGCVSYLNARPLIDGLEAEPGIQITTDVPSGLLSGLLEGRTELALCPTIDYQTAAADLRIVDAGAIGSNGKTLTVRLLSHRPLAELDHVVVDGDSKTSVALLQIVLFELYGLRPRLSTARLGRGSPIETGSADAVLLIGDKVITSAPDLPHQLDLGEAWKRITGLPFVFATWMTTAGSNLGELPARLRSLRLANRSRVAEIAERHAPSAGWPHELATRYLGELLRYDLGDRELEAIGEFWARCRVLGLIEHLRPLELYGGSRA
jgi:chorismate dehydratase